MLHELWKSSEALDKILFESHRMRGGEADAIESFHRMERFQKLDEGALAIDFWKLVATVEIDDLTEQRDLTDAPLHQNLCL